MAQDLLPVESHPWGPFIPVGTKVLILGTFPPKANRWCMDFYYPNPTNDFWRIMGLIFRGDKSTFWDSNAKKFDLLAIKDLLTTKHIAVGDTAKEVRRLRDNASDKYLEILTPLPLASILEQIPECHTIVTTGEKAAGVIATLTDTSIPKTGEYVEIIVHDSNRHIKIWRMPSTSRAYPLAVEKKAEYYAKMFRLTGII